MLIVLISLYYISLPLIIYIFTIDLSRVVDDMYHNSQHWQDIQIKIPPTRSFKTKYIPGVLYLLLCFLLNIIFVKSMQFKLSISIPRESYSSMISKAVQLK